MTSNPFIPTEVEGSGLALRTNTPAFILVVPAQIYFVSRFARVSIARQREDKKGRLRHKHPTITTSSFAALVSSSCPFSLP